MTPTRRWTKARAVRAAARGRPVKAMLVALVLAACAFAFAIGTAWADDGGAATAPPSQGAPAPQPVQQEQQDRPPRDDCPEKDGAAERLVRELRRLSGSEQVLSLRPAAPAGWRGIMGLTSCQ